MPRAHSAVPGWDSKYGGLWEADVVFCDRTARSQPFVVTIGVVCELESNDVLGGAKVPTWPYCNHAALDHVPPSTNERSKANGHAHGSVHNMLVQDKKVAIDAGRMASVVVKPQKILGRDMNVAEVRSTGARTAKPSRAAPEIRESWVEMVSDDELVGFEQYYAQSNGEDATVNAPQ